MKFGFAMGASGASLLLLLSACVDGAASSSSTTEGAGNEPEPEVATSELGSVVADLRADTNRDGVVSFTDPTDDTNEDVWNGSQGAVFLANIDDDQESCDPNASDLDLPKCNDAADEIVNGADDALDLARLKTKPWPDAPAATTARIAWTNPTKVRLFKKVGSQFQVIQSGAALSPAEIKTGMELAIEGKDIVRDTAVWNGFVDFTYTVEVSPTERGVDKLRMRVAPVMTYHHLLPAEKTWVSQVPNSPGNAAMRADLKAAALAAGVPAPNEIPLGDAWAQDFFEPGFMSMPAANGKQHVIRVNYRSANMSHGASPGTANPLRPAGRFVFALRGKDTAGIQAFDPARQGEMDSLNSFGNLETVPPYSLNGVSYPMGRVLRGNVAAAHPDKVFLKVVESQAVQPPIYIDTSWLTVGHVDETMSFVKANTPRGWILLVNDPRLAKKMLQDQSNAGRGTTPMFVGKQWKDGTNARVTIDEVLNDTEVMSASAEAAIEVDGQIAKLKSETGLRDNEIIRIPYLHRLIRGLSIAYQPGMVNGLYLSDQHFAAPNPHGPLINGQDIFKAAMEDALEPLNIAVHWTEDWDTYHRNNGEVHCGSNSTRAIPTAKWWESGR